MAAPGRSTVWDGVIELTKKAQEQCVDPHLWASRLSANLKPFVEFPSTELAEVLVSYICWDNNLPILWKFLHRAIALNLVSPLLVLSLLALRVVPNRSTQSAAYRLYLELLKRYVFTIKDHITGSHYHNVMNSVANILRLPELFPLETDRPGLLVVEFVFKMVSLLLDACLTDEGLIELSQDSTSLWLIKSQDMEIDEKTGSDEKLQSLNNIMAIEMIAEFLRDTVISRLLYLVFSNRVSKWHEFVSRVKLLAESSSALRSSKVVNSGDLLELVSNKRFGYSRDSSNEGSLRKSNAIVDFGSLAPFAGLCHGASLSSLWLPLDLVFEDAMDGYQVNPTSAIEIITGLAKTLKGFNGSTWHDTFLGIWIAALRLVQRERDPIEGPIPRLDTRLCMSLCIVPLVVASLIEEGEYEFVMKTLRGDLVTSLQVLGEFPTLLAPPQCVVSAANKAATKAIMFLSGGDVGKSCSDVINMKDMPINCRGNMRHLIVEACIARNILDTSAYSWPGYVNGQNDQIPQSLSSEVPCWSSFVKGAPLNAAMVKALVSVPASSLTEVEKLYEVAVKGSDDEKISAAIVLCGASLTRGWNIQEHTVEYLTRLLSPPVPADYSGDESHLIGYACMLNAIIVGIGSVDSIQIFSLHGMVPQLACSLMPICEVFGSYTPSVSWTLPSGEEISAYSVFSNAFTLLLKLWRFNHPPIEHGVGDVPTVGSQLTLEHLLLVRNSHLVSSETLNKDRNRKRLSEVARSASCQPVFVDSFPKLKLWYRQHQRCIASTLSELTHGSPVHQTVEALLTMMFRKVNSGTSSSSGAASEDIIPRPEFPAWDILKAVPYVVDAALTACSHGRLCTRDLATGLKDLTDFLPASLATIVSYLSAEVSRGVWKQVFMNGIDWPNPAANLSKVEEYIKKILATTGVDIPSLAPAGGSSPATLPLPLAAFVTLTITYKVDKSSERFLNLAGPALECLAAACPWPCMPIVASLWTQKAKRWFEFLVFSASRTVFLHNPDAVVQLLRNCFSATLGLNAAPMSYSVGSLLGHGGIFPVAPGILYLRMYRALRDTVPVTEEILSLLIHSVKDIVQNRLSKELKTVKTGSSYGQSSLATAMTQVKLAASLSASLVWLTGGLGVVHLLIKETIPSWFLSVDQEQEGPSELVAELRGNALAYFVVLCGAFAWGMDWRSAASKRRQGIMGSHLEFLASALDGKISVGCETATWRAYITGLVSLMVSCLPSWVIEIDTEVMKSLSNGLRRWGKDELAVLLLSMGGLKSMDHAAEFIIHSRS
ncbi:Mediator of RNA polymerase II transcription subunit 33A [Raphanus sativus]|uniref:Mediator of RNA polymerase II transcription subunit 33A n=1 Tax=Raphanus sativus TaxID=3726 RepID=A0A9W3C2D1_RAPSA|nr:mediator of RNA polymerase II transcription subunit 33A [Raphanus sativus]KAJ4887219.1 Mediator of RNA polymerase II transcription subunit 33A [Raphanus sativus]